jgi:cytochrome bd ubiquinol oxidase subunit I
MLENFDYTLVDWSRAQFALTAMYHWLFVPLTLGLSFIMAIMETFYVKTGDESWKKATKFWMTLFGVNFAIGIATGLILEFEFGTNWSNYSWFVGDIFGAPLAIEGIMAFFMESTFVAVMFFGWNKVSKRFHLLSTWLVGIGANLSALWILVANAWMQHPTGMVFNPATARNEMMSFWEVLLSPMAVNKFLHTITSGFVLAAVFVIAISAWLLLKKRSLLLAKRSMVIASVFGLVSGIYLMVTGDKSAQLVAANQPMKLAAMEGLYHGNSEQSLTAFGILVKPEENANDPVFRNIAYKIEIPKLLSFLAFRDFNAFVPGVNDLIDGNPKRGILSATEKMERGSYAKNMLKAYSKAKKEGDTLEIKKIQYLFASTTFRKEYFRYFGYSFLNNPNSLIPNVPLTFYSFHIMVVLGFYFIIFFAIVLLLVLNKKIEEYKWLLQLCIFTLPFVYIASECGWIVAEVGRQPWIIQDLLPTVAAVSHIDASAVQITLLLFAVLFTSLLIAEISIMLKQIKIGPKEEGE